MLITQCIFASKEPWTLKKIPTQSLEDAIITSDVGLCIKKVVVWGHKLHVHTHSYTYNAWYRAFKYLGYPTYWLDDSDDVKSFDFAGALFITEGQVDGNIPLRDDCYYMLHYPRSDKYDYLLKLGRAIKFHVHLFHVIEPHFTQVGKYLYFDLPSSTFYFYWATDLLPYEIDINKRIITHIKNERIVHWVGSINNGSYGNVSQLVPFVRACRESNIKFMHHEKVSVEDNVQLIQKSYMAPAIQGERQALEGNIVCRIFKNISYGQMGITNSAAVADLFEGRLIYNSDTYQLFFDAEKKLKLMKQEELFGLMDYVRDNHTYLNRIDVLFKFFELVIQKQDSKAAQ